MKNTVSSFVSRAVSLGFKVPPIIVVRVIVLMTCYRLMRRKFWKS